MSTTTERRVRIPYPHKGQRYVREHLNRYNWLCFGRKWFKTSGTVGLAIEDLLAGKRFFWGAPTSDQVRIAWDEARYMSNGLLRFSEKHMRCELPGHKGSGIFRSLHNPENARGHTVDKVFIDEVQDVSTIAIEEDLFPMLLATNGEFLAEGTPKGIASYFYEKCQEAIDDPDSAFFHGPTKGCRIVEDEDGTKRLVREPHPLENDLLPWAAVESMFRRISEVRFRQEILAQFVAMSGRVFSDFDNTRGGRHIREVRPSEVLQTRIGIDFGFRTFAMIATQIDKQGCVRQFAEGEWNDITTERAIKRIKLFDWAPAIRHIHCDPAGDSVNLQSGRTDVSLFRKAFPNAQVTYSMQEKHRDPEHRAGLLRDRLWTASGESRYVIDPSCKATIRMWDQSIYNSIESSVNSSGRRTSKSCASTTVVAKSS